MTFASKSLLAALAVATLGAPVAAQAETLQFTYCAVEVEQPESARKLLERVRYTAQRACASSSPVVSIKNERECREDLVSQLVEAIDSPLVTALVSDTGVQLASVSAD